MNSTSTISRRDFIKVVSTASTGLVIGFNLPFGRDLAAIASEPNTLFEPNAWIRIGTDGIVTIIVDKSEMGQGVMTSLPMLVAEELEVDWSKIRIESAPADPVYNNTMFGMQATGGSTSVRSSWDSLRKAGATAREMLIGAAAQIWGIEKASCRAENGSVVHQPSGRKLNYGDLVELAGKFPVPKEVTLKDVKDLHIIGKRIARLDTPKKVDGSAVFGLDVKIPGMLLATVARCPVFGGKVASFNTTRAKNIKGVRHVVQIESGIAVVADSLWSAVEGRRALAVKWHEGLNVHVSSLAITKMFKQLAQKPGAFARNDGDVARALASSSKKVNAVYEVPFLAHATMEPMNCTAHVRTDGCDVWAPTQFQSGVHDLVAKITGQPKESIKVHTTLLGGGFGRRFELDFVAEALQISKAVNAPVKVVWSREDDMQHDFYRPATYNRLSAGLDPEGTPVAWTHRIVGPSIMSRVFPAFVKNGIDASSIEGAADLPYDIPNIHVDYVMKETGVPVGFWRSVGHSQNAFVTECFLDELAVAGGKDPYELRRQLLSKSPRHKAVLELAASKAGWGTPLLPAGRHRGIAVHESFGSFIAQVAEVSVSKDGLVRVHRVVCAVDCGIVVNPDTIEAQMESAIVYGLTAALKGEITIEKGRVNQSNFDDYEMLRIDEMPVVEVHIMASNEPPGGVGEPGVPPIAPAVANAVFAAKGKRIRRLPIHAEDLRKA